MNEKKKIYMVCVPSICWYININIVDAFCFIFPPQKFSFLKKGLFTRIGLLAIGGMCVLYIRWRIMGTGPPAFTDVDNPASFADSLFVRVSIKPNALTLAKHWQLILRWMYC